MGPPPHILIVDDHAQIRESVARFLEKNGMRTTVARDAVEMDAKLATGHFDLLVLDVMMPGEDGLSVCRRLAPEGDLPIIMLTALGEEPDRIVGLEIGARRARAEGLTAPTSGEHSCRNRGDAT